MEDRYTETPSGRIHSKVAGSGNPILLLHGYSPDVNSWRTWEKNIDALASSGRVYALDMLGYGESDSLDPLRDARGQANALVQLMDAEGMTQASLVGLSWGGVISQVLVGLVPDRIRKLVLVDSGYDDSEKGIARLHKITAPTLIVWDEQDAVIPVAGAHFLAANIPQAQLRILKSGERDPGAKPEERHWSQASHSTAWNRVVSEFLAR